MTAPTPKPKMTQEEINQKLAEIIDEASDLVAKKVVAKVEAERDLLSARVEELEALLALFKEAEAHPEVQYAAEKAGITTAGWMLAQLEHSAKYAEFRMIPVDPIFYNNLKALANARGIAAQSLTIGTDFTNRLNALLDNLLI